MTFVIETVGGAFDPEAGGDLSAEVARILNMLSRRVGAEVIEQGAEVALRDLNGAPCGRLTWT